MTTKSDIAGRVENRLSNIPAALTSTIIEEYVEDAHVVIENETGDSFSTSDIPTEYESLITDITIRMVVDYMLTDLIKESASIGGDMSVNYADMRTALENIKRTALENINSQFDKLGSIRNFDYTSP